MNVFYFGFCCGQIIFNTKSFYSKCDVKVFGWAGNKLNNGSLVHSVSLHDI